MTHIQEIFIQNVRFYRSQAGYSQLTFSEKIGLSQNYMNAIENGKNFPSVDVLQKMTDELNIFPYQLFLETPYMQTSHAENETIQFANELKQKIIKQFDDFIKAHS